MVAAQSTIRPVDDTTRVVQILKGNSLREKIVDTISFQTIAGDVELKESLTLFYCDSAAINKTTNIMEAFGNVHINQQDSIHTYAQYLKYIGKERMAYLKKNVRLTDKKGTLFTDELEYDLKTNIGNYKKGGRVVNGKTVLTSDEGTYYGDTKDVYFKKKVHLVDPKYDITTDSLIYNTTTQVVTFITGTNIKSKDGTDIYTTSGTYDLKNGKAFFGNRTIFKDSSRVYVANNVAIDEKTQTAQLEGDAVVRDSTNGYTILGGQIFVKKNDGSFLATRKPVLIFKGEGDDSTFVAADTLFSGIIKKDSSGSRKLVATDTLTKTVIVQNDSVATYAADNIQTDTTKAITINEIKKADSLMNRNDSIVIQNDRPPVLDTAAVSIKASIVKPAKNMTLQKDTAINIAKDTAVRYFQAFHHVRIFNDSLQAVCDSLFYSSEDSVFRLYTEPVVFSNKSQITGDTIHLYTKNKKANRIYVFDNGIIINELNKKMYNQIGGRTLNGYFKEGVLDYMRVKGSPAESIFYPQDDDSAITGMNRCSGDLIDIYFVDKAVNKVKVVNDVNGIMYPLNQVPEEQKQLPRFSWQDARRPKNKLELFE